MAKPISQSNFLRLHDPRWHVPGTTPAEQLTQRPLPMTRAEMNDRGWDACDIILVTGDAYVDHPSFGVALIGRFLEWLGYRVGIIAAPDPTKIEDFRALGAPALFWGVTAGNLDSQLMRYTVMRKKRSDDAYAPSGKAGTRPPNASIVYTAAVRQAYKGVPVVLGGVEASLRRFPYYDYWTDSVKRSLLLDAKADLIAFGMAERALAEIACRLREGRDLTGIAGTAELRKSIENLDHIEELPPYDEVAAATPEGKQAFARMFRAVYLHMDPNDPTVLVQRHGDRTLVVHPLSLPLEQAEIDLLYALPFTRHPHPRYHEPIPAYEMIKDSITTHRGCYAGCSFCAIGAHQGTAISSRSQHNIIAEIERLATDRDFHGTISDLGGPTANMYRTGCSLGRARCRGKSCLHPHPCKNLNTDHGPVLKLLRAARKAQGVKHAFVSSGIRFDLALTPGGAGYVEELARHHTGGRLKIAPEHIVPSVLRVMRKPEPALYSQFVKQFRDTSERCGRAQGIVEYFISGHPGCTLHDMVALAEYLHKERIQPEQIQDFYPAPLTLAATMYYTGIDPLTNEPVYVARSDHDKALQRALLLCHKPEFQRKAREALRLAGRHDLIGAGKRCLVPPGP